MQLNSIWKEKTAVKIDHHWNVEQKSCSKYQIMKIIETTEKMVSISVFLSLIFLTGSLSDVTKVKVSLYYESLCPFCDKYIVEVF